MGDIADWTNDCMQDANPDWMPVGDPYRRGRAYGPALRCKFCGSCAVYWQMTRSGYRLHNTDDLQLHNCRSTKDMNTEGFDDAI